MSRQAAWQLYNRDLRAAIDRGRKRAGLSDEDASALADAELRKVRSRRRR